MRFHDPEVVRILAAAHEAEERGRAALAAYERQVTDSLARERERAANPVCPCCHRPMTDPDDTAGRLAKIRALINDSPWGPTMADLRLLAFKIRQAAFATEENQP